MIIIYYIQKFCKFDVGECGDLGMDVGFDVGAYGVWGSECVSGKYRLTERYRLTTDFITK